MPDTTIVPYKQISPQLADDVFVASGTRLAGDIVIGRQSSLWFNVSARGDVEAIRIGECTNIQDNTVLHVSNKKWPCLIGNRVTVGHNVILHGCRIEDEVLIGMGAIVLDGAHILKGSFVAAGALVPPGKTYPENMLIVGSPAVAKRPLTKEERDYISFSADHYAKLAEAYGDDYRGIRTSAT